MVEKFFMVKPTSEQSHVYSDKISTNPTESFNQSPPNNRTDGVSQVFEEVPWNFMNSTVSSNKIKKSSIYKNTPLGNDFWKYTINSPKVSTVTADPTLMSQTRRTERYKGNLIKSKKRGSWNTDIEKVFRWFYTFGYSSKNNSVNRGVYIYAKERVTTAKSNLAKRYFSSARY